MTVDERKKYSETLLLEILERLGANEGFKGQLEAFSGLPAGRVAERLVKQFENSLSAQMRDLLINLIQQDINAEKEIAAAMKEQEARAAQRQKQAREAKEAAEARRKEEARLAEESRRAAEVRKADESGRKAAPPAPGTGKPSRVHTPPEVPSVYEVPSSVKPAASIMEHFGTREALPTEPIDFEPGADDWLYLYGFCYAPETSGKGVPVKKLAIRGFDRKNDIFLLDYGDIRFFVSRITASDYTADKGGKPTLDPQKSVWYRYDHEKIINLLRTTEVIVPLNAWSIFRGLGEVTRMIEDRYVDLLRTLIDAHDATEWEVEVFGNDDHIIKLPTITQEGKVRTSERESRHVQSKGRDVKHVERLIFREKTIAQEIHSNLLYYAQRGKLDHMIRLDSAFMTDWKSILVCRYTVQKDKRKKFCEGINSIYDTYDEYHLTVRVINPTALIRLAEA